LANRTTFLIDGFNLYHSICQAQNDLGCRVGLKWLDLRSLCSSYLHIVGGGAQLQEIFYFSALATHCQRYNPGKVDRHRNYIKALRSSGVKVELGRFKEKEAFCSLCKRPFTCHEEKETDVAISVKILELLHLDRCDTAVVVSGDTDVAPAVRAAKRLFPSKLLAFAFPYARHNAELKALAHVSWNIDRKHYAKFQFPDPVTLSPEKLLSKPVSW